MSYFKLDDIHTPRFYRFYNIAFLNKMFFITPMNLVL